MIYMSTLNHRSWLNKKIACVVNLRDHVLSSPLSRNFIKSVYADKGKTMKRPHLLCRITKPTLYTYNLFNGNADADIKSLHFLKSFTFYKKRDRKMYIMYKMKIPYYYVTIYEIWSVILLVYNLGKEMKCDMTVSYRLL